MEQNDSSNSGRGPPKEQTLVEMHLMVTEEMSFEVYSIKSSGGHFVPWSRMI